MYISPMRVYFGSQSESFDYTEWQKDLYGDMPLDEFYEKVKIARIKG